MTVRYNIIMDKIDNSEIITSLRTLGLEPGATSDDIHSAFRRLARELHPDVTGSKSDFRFRQVTGAYNILKNLSTEELNALPRNSKRNIYDYYSETKRQKADAQKIDSILDKYEQELKTYYAKRTSSDDSDLEAIIFRLKSTNHKVINAALKHSGNFANRVEFRIALVDFLKRSDVIDDSTAEITGALPFDDNTRKLIAMDSVGNAQNFPTGLIISLIGNDADVMESFLMHVKPDDVAVILRRWPAGRTMNSGITRTLLESDDARILVPLLLTMRTHFPKAAALHKKRLQALENHSTAAVRAWAKKLT